MRRENYDKYITTGKNPNFNSVLYLTSEKVSQYRVVADNRI